MAGNTRQTSKQREALAEAGRRAGLSPSAVNSARRWLAELMVADEYAKLGQGGHTKSEVPLRRVFVDLPVATPQSGPGRREPFLAQLLDSPPLRLRSACLAHGGSLPRQELDGAPEPGNAMGRQRSHSTNNRSATLLIGGPGQGKSTLGQLACQLHRAALLIPSQANLSAREKDVLEAFTGDEHTSPGLSIPERPLLPIHVALPELAAWLAERDLDSTAPSPFDLLAFVTSLPSAQKQGLVAETLLDLAPYLPVLLVLDGFDEVGATTDRERIVRAARELLLGLAERDASAQILATTRPQGYAGELDHIGVSLLQQNLVPLEAREALTYAGKLVKAKIAGVDLQKKTMVRLREAASGAATARLLTTPLQVTIITALVQQGRAPKERWRLFWSYFDYTYKREIERETYASPLLADHRAHIEAIHARVALLLQVEAERAGGATARMSQQQLRSVVEAVLTEDWIGDQPREEIKGEREELVADILKAAGERLVFLVEPEPGRFGFEIRSLQEFMAAWAISSGPDAQVRSRMVHVARAPMFRNVLLFVASRLYSESSHLREILPEVLCGPPAPDYDGELDRDLGGGANLALELLEEGAVLNQPRHAAALLARAIRVLDLPVRDEQPRLARITADDWGAALQTAIEDRLKAGAVTGMDSMSAGAWVCLLESINAGRPWAEGLAARYMARGAPVSTLLLACDLTSVRIGDWLLREFEQSAPLLSISAVIARLSLPGMARNDAPGWAAWLAKSLSLRPFSSEPGIPDPFRAGEQAVEWIKEPAVAPPPEWTALIDVGRFSNSPDCETLATALDAVASSLPRGVWHQLANVSPWPLASCLRVASDPGELRAVGGEVRSGRLGDARDWTRMEADWGAETRPSWHLGDDGQPWSTSPGAGPPLASIPPWALFHWIRYRAVLVSLVRASAAFEGSHSPARRAMLGRLCLSIVGRPPAESERPHDVDPTPWLEAAPDAVELLVPRPAGVPTDVWIGLLDRFPLSDGSYWHSTSPADFLKACVEANGHPTTLRLALRSLGMLARRRSMVSDPAHLRERIVAAAASIRVPTPETAAYAAILRTAAGDVAVGAEGEVVSSVGALAASDGAAWQWFVDAIAVSPLPRGRAVTLLHLALDSMVATNANRVPAVEALVVWQQAETTGLHQREVWNRLGLPTPLPHVGADDSTESAIPRAPVVISKLELRDVRGISGLSLLLPKPDASVGQWVVLLGPNGVGKTTILRAIAVALRNALDPSIWPDDAFALPWVRAGADEARVTVTLSNGVCHETRIRSHGGLRVTQQPEHIRPRLFPLFGYGCRRGSALGGVAKEVNLKDDGGPEVATLFSEGRDIIHAETWLLILDGDASRNPGVREVFGAVIAALQSLIDVSEVTIADRRVWVTEKTGRKIPFESLSDGYLTTAGWFLDLTARWIELLVRNGEPVESDFLQKARGIVLIDELDLHLHPRWQIEAIGRIRRLLPQMSFVVTTHNPLTLVGASPKDIWILPVDGRDAPRTGSETPMLLTGGQIFRQYFGIEDLYPDSLGRKIQRYAFLSSYAQRNEAEQAEMLALVADLQAASLLPEWEIVPRAASKGTRKPPVRRRRSPT